MRKAYRKARWKRMAERIRKRGGMVFFYYKKFPNVETPKYPITYSGLVQCLSDLGYEYEGAEDGED